MITSVWKLRPTNIWKIPEIEQWLSDMAKEGLHLHKIGIQFGKFKRGEAQNLLYRIDISDEKTPSNEDLQKYELAGWKYVTSYNDFHIYFSRKNRHPEPFPINNEKLMATIRKRKRSSLWSIPFSLFFLIGTIWIQFLAYSKGIPVILKIVEGIGYNSFHPLLIMPLILYVYLDVSKYRLISTYQKQLLDISPKNHHVEWQWHLPRRIWGSIIQTFLIVGSLLIIIIPIFQTEYKTLSVEDTQPYVVRLHTVTHPEKLKLSNVASEDYTYEYTVTSNWSIFAPKYYDVSEEFVTSNVDSNTMARIYSKVYDLSFSFLAEPLLHDLIKDTSSFEDPTKLQEVSHKQFDLLYVLEQEHYVKIYAAKDSIVTYVIHFGDPNTDTLIEELASRFHE